MLMQEFPEAAFIREVGLPNESILDIIFGSCPMVVPKGLGIEASRVSLEDSDSEASTAGSDKVELMLNPRLVVKSRVFQLLLYIE